MGRTTAWDGEFFDLQRVEVLRGPQGTLFGRNSVGGAINMITARPDFEEFSASLGLGLGSAAVGFTRGIAAREPRVFGMRLSYYLR